MIHPVVLSLTSKSAALLAGVALFTAVGCSSPSQQPSSLGSDVPERRLWTLNKGLNIGFWFAQAPAFPMERFDTFQTERDFRAIRSMGFRHIRLPLRPMALMWTPVSRSLSAPRAQKLAEKIKMINDIGLVVILDLHLEEAEKKATRGTVEGLRPYAQFWTDLAPYIRSISPDDLVIEVMNEPFQNDPQKWWRDQGEILKQVRRAFPQHTLMAGGDGWCSIRDLIPFRPYPDRNIVYKFHFYDPLVFTHQGAGWARPGLENVTFLDYPTNPKNARRLRDVAKTEEMKYMLDEYERKPWNRARIRSELIKADAWAEKWNVPITCTEFGVFKVTVDPGSSSRYLRDVRMELESMGIGWTMWEYVSQFGVTREPDRMNNWEPHTIGALGMRMPRIPK